MVGSRTATAIAGVVVSLLVSAAVWWLFDVGLLFFFVPFVPFLLSRHRGESEQGERDRRVRTCPACGFRTANREFDYCPRDGTRLETERGQSPGDGR